MKENHEKLLNENEHLSSKLKEVQLGENNAQ